MQNFVQSARPFIPTFRDFLQTLPVLLAIFFLGGGVDAQTIDQALGSDVTSKGCTLINSVESSIALKLLCGAVVLWGIIKFIPTRKDGVGQMIAGVVGFLVVSKFTTIMGVFGMKCG
ncbi:hypothetical protein [Deinococcus aluminii]|uniref:Uncharacterized protein n=1 Tax=Deinococcus aluminii TaxID=1656885 RepID=A0ABP9XEW5_9DEIO